MRSIPAWLAAALLAVLVPSAGADPLPGTAAWQLEGDRASRMVEGIDRFLLREIAASVEGRARHWRRDYSSHAAYEKSGEPNRQRLKKIIGAADERVPADTELQVVGTPGNGGLVGQGNGYNVFAVRRPVFRGVHVEALLLLPDGRQPLADCIALPDADQTPEMLVGLEPGVAEPSQFARRLAERGCRVLVPYLVDRSDTYSVAENGQAATNQPHREFVYRPAFELGRHVIGYEVQKVLALVDWLEHSGNQPARGGSTTESSPREAGSTPQPSPTGPALAATRSLGIFGYGEGGLLALYAGAADLRIDAVAVSGYFAQREDVWQEPIYRNVFGLLDQFGDAELASLVAPRALVVEACRGPEVAGPPPERAGRRGAAPGRLTTPELEKVEREFARAQQLVGSLSPPPKFELVASGEGQGPFGTAEALEKFDNALLGGDGRAGKVAGNEQASPGAVERLEAAAAGRASRQVEELIDDTQHLMREAEYVREAFWAKADRSSLERWQETTRPYREYFRDEVIGRFERPLLKPNPRTRQVYDEPAYRGYEVQLDVFPDVFAYGLLLVPKDLRPGERRPVVVCQHGLEGRPQDVADPKVNHPAYEQYACRLAERGFVVYAPQNPYIFGDRFRTLQRKANPLGKTLFSIIVPQHQQTVDWLASLPFVDAQRIGFYGLSYGGKTAMRVPALVDGYCLSICSADFNEWIWKNASTRSRYSYVSKGEYEIFEFDLGNTFNYAEMAGLIAPRAFMVERGHRDGVAPDWWVGYEYAKVRLLYADLKIPQQTEIEFFDGPHKIHGVGTFEFLHRHLKWPQPQAAGE